MSTFGTPSLTKVLAFVIASSSILRAGAIGPDSFGYSAVNGGVHWTDISATGTALFPANGNIDDESAEANIGFNFDFYGNSYSSVFASTNGLITFLAENSSFSNAELSTTDQSSPTIAAYWDDLRTGNGNVYVQTAGAPGSRTFTIQWNNAIYFTGHSNNTINFDIVLFETLNVIQFNYLNLDSGNGTSATVGIADANGIAAGRVLQWSFDGQTFGAPAAESSITFGAAPSGVPEPGSVALLGSGLAALAVIRLRRKKA